ncbi:MULTISPECIES: 1-acyl-sn-glycerol-3-phosphate acyltransferase [Nocardia]|jgi:glycerol-3-phosphate O-acyltransferase|uniref:Glycerol-3-phosphate acyltransferase n=2 Tax=Nocardia TaxID=1817 RepID=A0A2T2ZCB2_9NOCA|nr:MULTISPECIES: 1-acyl-sn-glycerol-3-phosphate acyltransferase [Nocardia]MDN2496797.1 glycerol-3-phosphate acyltransferase [Nocardia nova]PSR65408.1 glycerol-3-phosphate acyltransferase [Nocardia nova]
MTSRPVDFGEYADDAAELAQRLDRPIDDVLDEIRSHHQEMSATHNQTVLRQWHGLGRWMLRGYDRLVDEERLADLRALDRGHSLVFLISHRSYLDEWVFPSALVELGLRTPFGFAGANLDFFPLGTIARRTGIVHIRRATGDIPVYKLALRTFIRRLVADRSNMIWSIEGGRSRTGKLRPPRMGLLRYVADAVEEQRGSDVLLVPVSILYDQLPTHEVEKITAEARGQGKTPENVRWFFGYLRGLRRRLGRVYVDFGEPIELRSRLRELKQNDAAETTAIERIAVEVSHRINRATPVAPTAVVCIALLAADRALTLDEVLETVEPLADYLHARNWQTAGAANLTDRATVRRALQDLVKTGVLSSFRGDTTVWGIRPSQHLVAAVYRNSAIHALIERAIVEVALEGASATDPAGSTTLDDALRLRDLLKFEFFFAGRTEFTAALQTELDLITGATIGLRSVDGDAAACLDRLDLFVAPLMLRPFIDAYAVVAYQLAELGGSTEFDEGWFMERCLAVGHQWALQGRNASAESTSAEMFQTALRLVRHLGLLDDAQPDLELRRKAFRREIEAIQDRIGQLSRRAAERRTP